MIEIAAMAISQAQKSAIEFLWLIWHADGPNRNDTPVAVMDAVKIAAENAQPNSCAR